MSSGFFWTGLVFDTTGTIIMGMLSNGFRADIHGITGVVAILPMVFHAIWATMVLRKGDEEMITKFHVFSVFVWVIWLIPFITGMLLNMK